MLSEMLRKLIDHRRVIFRRRVLLVAAVGCTLAVLTSCSSTEQAGSFLTSSTSPGTAETANPTEPSSVPSTSLLSPDLGEPIFEVEIPDAISVNIAAREGTQPAVAWVTSDSVLLARLEVETGHLMSETTVSGGAPPFAHPIERPAISIGPDDALDIAFTSLADGGSVFHTKGGISGFPEPTVVSGDPRPETNLVHATRDPSDQLVLAWLEDSTLSVATEADGSISEVELVDDLTCDCCNPAPRFVGDRLVVAYRDYEVIDGAVVRNVKALASPDGGATFSQPIPVADEDWFIDACPFSGPSGVVVGDTLIVTWMDARQSTHPDQSTSSIWVDRSNDAGNTFSTDILVTDQGINRWPMIAAADDGSVHLVWEVQGVEGGLFYSSSSDTGETFSTPAALVTGADRAGAPKSPSVAFHEGLLLVTWGEGTTGYLAAWRLPS